MDGTTVISPAERAAVASIPARIADLSEDERVAIDRAYDRLKNTPEGQQAEVDRIAALEVTSVPNFLRGAL